MTRSTCSARSHQGMTGGPRAPIMHATRRLRAILSAGPGAAGLSAFSNTKLLQETDPRLLDYNGDPCRAVRAAPFRSGRLLLLHRQVSPHRRRRHMALTHQVGTDSTFTGLTFRRALL